MKIFVTPKKLAAIRLSWILCFSDEEKFHLDGIVNRHNCKTPGSKPPPEIIEHQMDTPKLCL
jgi:hypothetical protein